MKVGINNRTMSPTLQEIMTLPNETMEEAETVLETLLENHHERYLYYAQEHENCSKALYYVISRTLAERGI